MLYSHDPKAPGVVAFAGDLEAVVRNELPGRVEIYEETLDFDRLTNRADWPRFAANIAAKYRGVGLDAVVAEGSTALQFGVETLAPVLPDMPIVYGNAFEPVVDFDALPSNVTGRRIPLPFAETFTFARRLLPEAKRVVLVVGAAPLDSVIGAHAVRAIVPLLNGMQFEIMENWSYPSLLQSVRELPKGTFVILSSLRKDWSGQSFNTGDIIPSLTRASAVPVFGVARNWVGRGIVGGTVMQFGAEGGFTGQLLLRVLRRPRGAPLPVAETAVNPNVADWQELQRWGLSENLLPRPTEVDFRTPSLWERYGPAIFLVLGVTIAQSALIGLLLCERHRRIRAQRSVQAQVVYEKMLAALRTDDAILRFPDEMPRALENAIAHVGRYAGAASAELVLQAEDSDRASAIVRWKERRLGSVSGPVRRITPVVALPLICESASVGTLTLRDLTIDCEDGSLPRKRLQVAAELIAVSLWRTQASWALEESRGHVAHLGRVATMGQLGAVVSHELRQPLAAIRFNAEAGALLLDKEPVDMNEVRAALHDIVDETAHAIRTIEHVRTLLRKQRGASGLVAINDICHSATRLLERDAQARGVTMDFELADGLPDVRGDAVQLQQVVLNLALNAIESAATSEGERRVVLSTAERANAVVLEVRDTGPGFAPDVQQRLFESYFSTKQSGLGMGLAIVRQIVEVHHGRVHAENNPGGGALFCVTLPVDVDWDDQPDIDPPHSLRAEPATPARV